MLQAGGACYSWRLPPPRWLGGGLRRSTQRRLCGAPEKIIVRGIVLTPPEPQRATLVERVIELPTLVGRFLWCPTCGLGG